MSTDVYILTGYLGSGKTTLLQQLLAYLRDKSSNVVVMMNEMGEEDVDGEQVEEFGFPVKKMLNGCICCSIRGELTENLREIMQHIKPEHLIIETTGVADPIEVVDAMTHPELYDRMNLKGIISVIDASRYLELTSFFQAGGALIKTIRNQVRYADLLIINKVDLVEEDILTKVTAKLQETNSHAPMHVTIRTEMDLEKLLQVKRLAQSREMANTTSIPVQKTIGRFSPLDKLKHTLGLKTNQPSLFHSIDTFSYHFKGPVDAEAFEDFLYDLPKTIYRAKGYVQFIGQDDLISFQQTQTQVHLFPFTNFGPKMVAVFIGEGFDKDNIIEALEKCYRTS
ncbi:CobW family GTP-binding protein [Brevibacillus laterosporus]|uniref:CobW family GTP-binding protein n=1 Tax=Brevibacillus laterosporus TaxID=1465 RepID=UPI00264B8735|nr:GTP-binding protein [Brevibacillus laterosporus]MDN9011951.1 GTP-binding protein [Brevibacillus laterosporus]MDO0943047.1 GTP-binding protein [Brevibacillus laterosporus]